MRPTTPGSRTMIASLLAATAILAGALAGCQQLFTTSLGKSLARTDLPIPATLSSSQAADLAAMAQSNTKLAGDLTASLVKQLGAAPNPATQSGLMGSAASAAVVASKTSQALTGVINDFAKTGSFPTDSKTLKSLLANIQSGASGTGVVTALGYLDPSTGLTAAKAKEAGLGATDLAIAAVVIASTVIPAGSDPTKLDVASLSAADKATLDVAVSILGSAKTLAGSNSKSADLLKTIGDNFSMPTVSATP
jgi:hypothetical protein